MDVPRQLTAHGRSREPEEPGVDVRTSQDGAVIVDDRTTVLAGEAERDGVTVADVVRGVAALYEAAWRAATPLASYDAQIAEIRDLAPKVLDLLNSGCKDESGAESPS